MGSTVSEFFRRVIKPLGCRPSASKLYLADVFSEWALLAYTNYIYGQKHLKSYNAAESLCASLIRLAPLWTDNSTRTFVILQGICLHVYVVRTSLPLTIGVFCRRCVLKVKPDASSWLRLTIFLPSWYWLIHDGMPSSTEHQGCILTGIPSEHACKLPVLLNDTFLLNYFPMLHKPQSSTMLP